MYEIYRTVEAQVSKLKSALLSTERNEVKELKHMCVSGLFEFIEENLNNITKDFINS